jgi:hypothetical protein
MSVTVASFKSYFDRGQFDYGVNVPQVRDKDIEGAMAEAGNVFNLQLYPPAQPQIADEALTYLTAHYLSVNLDAFGDGGQTRMLQESRGADGLSESLVIPEWMNAGEFSFYSTTYYGQHFLILSKPYLDGAVFTAHGRTRP